MTDGAEPTICVVSRLVARQAARRVTTWLALAVGIAIVSAAPVLAQRADSLRVGARVRVQPIHRPPPQVAGEVVAVDSVTMTLRDSDGLPQIVPLDEINRLERYDGRTSSFAGFRRGARRGFWVGLGTSAVLWAIALMNPECDGECWSPAEVALLTTIPIIATTTAVGGIIGSQYRSIWTSLPIPGCPDIVQCRKRPSGDTQQATAAPREDPR